MFKYIIATITVLASLGVFAHALDPLLGDGRMSCAQYTKVKDTVAQKSHFTFIYDQWAVSFLSGSDLWGMVKAQVSPKRAIQKLELSCVTHPDALVADVAEKVSVELKNQEAETTHAAL
jgi:hypothetical protein